MELLTILSLLGAILQVTAYSLMQLKFIISDSYKYQITNLAGSILLIVASLQELELMLGFFILEVIWAVVGFISLYNLIKEQHYGKL